MSGGKVANTKNPSKAGVSKSNNDHERRSAKYAIVCRLHRHTTDLELTTQLNRRLPRSGVAIDHMSFLPRSAGSQNQG